MLYYHASQISGIKILEPRTSNHDIPLIYFSTKRENVLVYLSNAIEKYCKEKGFNHQGKWHKWASYGFDTDGILTLDEYYPNAIKNTYKGVSGYIYYVNAIQENENSINISNAVTTSEPTTITDVEFIEDQQRIRPKNSEVFRLWGDNTKIKSLTGFEPNYSIEEGLRETIEWFTKPENLAKYKSNIYNV